MITLSDVKILVIGDPHFKLSGVPEHDKMCSSIIEIAKSKTPDLIVILGDILDRHETIHVSPLTRAIKFIDELIKVAPIYSLIGNHDLKNNKQFLSDEHGFLSYKLLYSLYEQNTNDITTLFTNIITKNVDKILVNDIIEQITESIKNINKSRKITFVDKVTCINFKGHNFVFVPYVPPGRFQEALDTCIMPSDISCIFAHQEFKGSQMGPIISVDGDLWNIDNPYVVSGHIHDYQNVQENILYVGTPIQHSFGDNPNKTISYITFESSSVRTEERINLGLPRKSTVRLSCEDVAKYIPPVNSKLRITIIGNHEELKVIMNHPNISDWKKLGHKIMTKDIPLVKNDNEIFIDKAPPKFSVALQNSIEENNELKKLYISIFGIPLLPKNKMSKLNILK